MSNQCLRITVLALALALSRTASWVQAQQESSAAADARQGAVDFESAKRLCEYFEQMSVAKPFVVRRGEDWISHRRNRQQFVLDCAGLNPLPQRVPLDVRVSDSLDHPWCTVRRVSYQLWPGVYSTGLLFMPKQFVKRPAPAVLCPHGHWKDGNAHPEVQKRCLNFARMGYVTFSSTQNHYEDLYAGVSHQTLMIWNNMRALDYLESLEEVDRARIAVAGASGGGLQTQMLAALDARVMAATVVGLTCDFRQIMFPDSSHCNCNHFPGVMQRTDHPEIASLALPAAVQYLTMNDWTKRFQTDNFPTIRELYAANGAKDRVFCRYFDTEHNYDRTKRELTYWWVNRWLRDCKEEQVEPEPDTETFPVEALTGLVVDQPNDKGFAEISRIYRAERSLPAPDLSTAAARGAYQAKMTTTLCNLLGEATVLPREAETVSGEIRTEDDLIVERIGYPSEGPLVVPVWVLRPKTMPKRKLPVLVMLAAGGRDALLAQTGHASPRERAGQGALVVLPDLRTFGESFLTGSQNQANQRRAWERNGIVWGRPVAGMAATDLRAVLDGVLARTDADPADVQVIAAGSGDLAIAALFAIIMDSRIKAAELDFAGACFDNRSLMLVPKILLSGDVPEWASLVSDRKLQIRNLPPLSDVSH